MFLKQGINYSAIRASENGMWGHSATPQDVCTSVRMLKGPVAQNFRNGDVSFAFGGIMWCSSRVEEGESAVWGQAFGMQWKTGYRVDWVAVKELKLSCYTGETLLFTIYIYTYVHIPIVLT